MFCELDRDVTDSHLGVFVLRDKTSLAVFTNSSRSSPPSENRWIGGAGSRVFSVG
jgi:hypothetical protein